MKLLEEQRNKYTSEHATTTVTNHEPSLESHQKANRFPPTDLYVAAKMAVFLGIDTATVAKLAGMYQELFLKQKPSLETCALGFSAWTDSLVLRALFDQFDVENGTNKATIPILSILPIFSIVVWEFLVKLFNQSGVPETYERIADWIMTSRDLIEAFVIDHLADAFDEYFARYGTSFKKRSKWEVQE